MTRILKLTNFKGLTDYTIKLPSRGVILMEGKSGIGKTTILEAISFVLYDTGGSNCYPRTDDQGRKRKTSPQVELIMETGLRIFRKKNPKLLEITHSQLGQLTGDIAQNYLTETFGSPTAWITGGYIKQDEYCPFFSLSSSDKLICLQELSYRNTSTQYKELVIKIDRQLEDLHRQLTEVELRINFYQEMYDKQYSITPIAEILWSERTFTELCNRYQYINDSKDWGNKLQGLEEQANNLISQNIKRTNELISQEQWRDKCEEELAMKKRDQADIIKKIREFGYTEGEIMDKIHQGEEEITHLQRIKLSTENHYLINRKTEIETKLGSWTPQWSLHQLNNFFSWAGKEEVISELIIKVKKAQEYQTAKIQQDQRNKLIQELTDCRTKYEKCPSQSVIPQIEEVNQKLWYLDIQEKVMYCPQCSVKLYLEENQLRVAASPETSFRKEEKANLNRQKNYLQNQEIYYRQGLTLKNRISELTKTIDELPIISEENPPELGNLSSNQLLDMSKKLREIPSQLPTVTDIKIEREKTEYYQELSKINERLKSRTGIEDERGKEDQIPEVEEKLREKTNKLAEYKKLLPIIIKYNIQLEEITTRCQNLEKNIVPPGDYTVEELRNLSDRLTTEHRLIKEGVANQIKLHNLQGIKEEYDKYFHQSKIINRKLEIYQKIKTTLITAEYIMIDCILMKINIMIENILNMMFDSPISLRLRSLRQLKTNDKIKPGINVEIFYKGAEFTTINELSGGERSRVSIALMVAFARLNNIPFLLLDESLANLDMENKELAIGAIRKYLDDKLVITVNHDTTEGIYESVIKV